MLFCELQKKFKKHHESKLLKQMLRKVYLPIMSQNFPVLLVRNFSVMKNIRFPDVRRRRKRMLVFHKAIPSGKSVFFWPFYD